MTTLRSSDWLPLVHSAHLPLPQFANCYSTTVMRMRADEADAAYEQVLVATAGAVFALQPDRAHRAQHTAHAREHRNNSANNLAAAAAAAAAAATSASAAASPSAAAPAAASSLSAASSFSSLSSLCALPLRGLPADGAELIAVDSFTVGRDRRPVLCVAAGLIGTGAHGKPLSAPTRFVLCIYGLHCARTDDLHVIAQDCVTIKLAFVPFVLTHSTLLQPQQQQHPAAPPSVDILLSGSDRSVHVYRWSSVTRAYAELPFTPAHPLAHLHCTPSAVLSLDVACSADRNRGASWTFVAAGHQDGLVRVATRREVRNQEQQQSQSPSESRSEEKAAESAVSPWQLGDDDEPRPDDAAAAAPALSTSSSSSDSECVSPSASGSGSSASCAPCFRYSDYHLDGPVSSASFFSPSTFLSDVFRSRGDGAESEQQLNDNNINRLQRRAYAQCTESHSSLCRRRVSFASSCYLSGAGCAPSDSAFPLVSPSLDSVLCATPLDLNLDGRAELLLGSYSAQLLVFAEQWDGSRRRAQGHDTMDEPADDATASPSRALSAPSGYALSARRQFAHPIYGVRSACVFGSACADLLVTSLYSVDVLSWQSDSAAEVLHNKIRCMEEIQQLESAIKQKRMTTQHA